DLERAREPGPEPFALPHATIGPGREGRHGEPHRLALARAPHDELARMLERPRRRVETHEADLELRGAAVVRLREGHRDAAAAAQPQRDRLRRDDALALLVDEPAVVVLRGPKLVADPGAEAAQREPTVRVRLRARPGVERRVGVLLLLDGHARLDRDSL